MRRFERYECSGCGETVCSSFAWNGRKWNRDGELVHLARIQGYQENPPVTRVCGTLTRVEDWVPPSSEEGLPGQLGPEPFNSATGENPLQTGAALDQLEEAPSGEAEPAGAEVPGVRESVSAKEGESEALLGRV